MAEAKPMSDHKDYLTWENAKLFVKHAKNLRDKTLFMFLLFSGRRVSEIINIRVKDIDFNNSTVNYLILKKRKDEYRATLPVNDMVLMVASEYIRNERLPEDAYLFYFRANIYKPMLRQTVNKIVRYYAEKYNIRAENGKYPHPHTFRHSFATTISKKIKNVAEAKVLQELLQHSDINTTFYYIKLNSRLFREITDNIYDFYANM